MHTTMHTTPGRPTSLGWPTINNLLRLVASEARRRLNNGQLKTKCPRGKATGGGGGGGESSVANSFTSPSEARVSAGWKRTSAILKHTRLLVQQCNRGNSVISIIISIHCAHLLQQQLRRVDCAQPVANLEMLAKNSLALRQHSPTPRG